MMVACSICQKSFKTAQGLRGHNFFVHTDNGDQHMEPVSQLAEQSSGFSLAPVSTEHRLSSCERRLAVLEQSTGAPQPDSAASVSNSSRKPLVEQVAEVTEQLKRLMSTSISHAELDPALEQLSKLAAQLNSLSTSRDSMMTSVGNLENRLSTRADQDMVRSLQTTISRLERWVRGIDELVATIQKAHLENQRQVTETMSSIADRLTKVEVLVRRFPTGEIVRIRLNDNREHHFREYSRPDGLAQPHKTKCDLILGDLWVDLAESED